MAAAALITGASRGLGRGIAVSLARAGYSLALGYRANEHAATATQQACQEATGGASAAAAQDFTIHRADIGNPDDRQRLVDEALDAFPDLDILVNNAGIAPRQRLDLIDSTEQSFDEVWACNLSGPHFLTQLLARRWLESPRPGSRSVVFITSISAEYASPTRPEYCISKAALSMSRQLWAARLAQEDVSVFEIRPGIMETDMTAGVKEPYDSLIAEGLVPQRRWGQPSDVGDAVAAMVSGAFQFSQGTVVDVDGGFALKRL